MTEQVKEGFEALTAESMPMVRKTFKVVGIIAFAFIWIAAMYMTLSAMLFRTEGQNWWVVVGMVALGIGADFWVGAGPVILRSSAKWGIKGWVVVGWITLAVALAFSFSNKLAYWVGTEDRHEAAQIAASVDHLEADRALVAANPNSRIPAAVRAERDATELAISAKEAEIASMPEEWPLRLRRAQRELLDLQTRYGALGAEYETAVAVAAAQARIDADRETRAILEAGAETQSDPMVEWVIGLLALFGIAATPAQALIWLHASYSLFHELAQFSFLGLATLRIPLHKLEEEQKFLISQKKLHATKQVEMLATDVHKMTQVKKAQASFKAARASIKQIAEAEAELETMRQLRDVERRKRAFLMEETPYDIPTGRLVEDMRDQANPAEEAARGVIDAVIEAGGSAEAAIAAAKASQQTTFKQEAAKDELSGDFIDYEQITYMRRKPKKKGEKLDRAVAETKTAPRGPKNTKRFWDRDGKSTEIEPGVDHDGGNRIAVGADGRGGVMESADVLKERAPNGAEGDNVEQNFSPQRASFAEDNQAGNEGENEDVENGGVETADEQSPQHPESSLSEEDLAALYELAASDPEQSVDSEAQHSEAEQEGEQEHNEPQTNPARLLAAAE